MSFRPAETADQGLDLALVGGLKALEARVNGGGSLPKPRVPRRQRGGDEATPIATA